MMKTRWMCVSMAMMLVMACAAGVALAASSPASGTWEMVPAKSKYSPGPAPKAVTVKVDASDKGYKVESVTKGADGKEVKVTFDAKFDGKDYPVKGQPGADMVSVKRVDDHNFELVMKKGTTTIMTITTVVAADGKSRTVTFKGTNEKGEAVNNVVYYDKK